MALVEVNWKPDQRQLRGFGALSVVFFFCLGLWIEIREAFLWISLSEGPARTSAIVSWSLAFFATLASIAFPRALHPLYVLMTAIALPIGFVVSNVIMAVIFFCLFAPIGIFFRIIGRDVLNRQFDERAESYWVERGPRRDRKRYFRQY